MPEKRLNCPKKNEESNTTKSLKSLLDQMSTKNELSHSKTVENIKTKSFETFSAVKFREPIDSFIDNSVDRHEIKISSLYSFNGHASH